jgi:undecaprenyl pyrophosphate phosphatase UppP
MKKAVSFIKNRVITGVVVIVPIAVIGIIMSDAIKKLITATTPFTSNMQIGGALFRTIIATILHTVTPR